MTILAHATVSVCYFRFEVSCTFDEDKVIASVDDVHLWYIGPIEAQTHLFAAKDDKEERMRRAGARKKRKIRSTISSSEAPSQRYCQKWVPKCAYAKALAAGGPRERRSM